MLCGIFQVKTLFQKLLPLLYKRAELDLRSTKYFELHQQPKIPLPALKYVPGADKQESETV